MASDSESDHDSSKSQKKHKKEKKEKKDKKDKKEKTDRDREKDAAVKEEAGAEAGAETVQEVQEQAIIIPTVTATDVIPKKDAASEKALSDKDKDRERDRDRDRDRGGRRPSRSNSRRRRDRRDRSRSYDRDRRRRRSRSPPRRRSRSRDRSRRDSRDRDRDRDRDRRERSRSRNRDDDKSGSNLVKPITLKDVLKAFPGISMPEAVQRMNAHNVAAAAANGGDVILSSLPMLGNVPNPLLGGGLVGEGGAATKPHRELYIGNLPPGVTVAQMTDFMNAAMKQMGLSKDGKNCVVSSWVSTDGHYAFVEVRSIEEANNALANLNGILIGANQLKVGRPKGYVGGPVPVVPSGPSGTTTFAGSSADSSNGSNVIMVTNLSALINETQAKELVATFGALKAFNLIKALDGQTQSAVFEYEDASVADGALQALNKLEVANLHLSVQRVPKATAALLLVPSSSDSNKDNKDNKDKDPLADLPPSKVLRMLNMVSPEDLADDENFTDLKEDVEEECGNYGSVVSIAIPRVGTVGEGGVGLIFVHFQTEEAASRAKTAIAGRNFNGKVVGCSYFPEDKYAAKEFGFLGQGE